MRVGTWYYKYSTYGGTNNPSLYIIYRNLKELTPNRPIPIAIDDTLRDISRKILFPFHKNCILFDRNNLGLLAEDTPFMDITTLNFTNYLL